jgi:hypothetical protein
MSVLGDPGGPQTMREEMRKHVHKLGSDDLLRQDSH